MELMPDLNFSVSEITIIVSIALFFLKIYLMEKRQCTKLETLVEYANKEEIFHQKINTDIDNNKIESQRQQRLCGQHHSSLHQILKLQESQGINQKYMQNIYDDLKKITMGTNDAIINNTAVLRELLVVIKNSKYR